MPFNNVPAPTAQKTPIFSSRKQLRKRTILAFCLWAFYWTALVIGTHLPGEHLPSVDSSDKTLHFWAYFGLAVLASTSVLLFMHISFRGWLILAAVLILYGAIDEITQDFVGRTTEFGDWVADSSGVIAGLIFVAIGYQIYRRLRTMLTATPPPEPAFE